MSVTINIPNYIKKAIDTILENNGEAYIVGGCVRDSLLGLPINDFDITSNLLPDKLKEIFSNYKIVNKNGEKHGTITVIIDHNEVEITTYRKDIGTLDGRHPLDVSFTTSLLEDVKRRDFTINAMAYNSNDGLIDYVDGISDLNNKIIKCVGVAETRFKEDYLRILRALRFSSKLGFKIEKDTKDAISSLYLNINILSKERILKELEGILLGDNVYNVLIEYKNVFLTIFPCLVNDNNYEINSKLLSMTKKNFSLRLAAILLNVKEEYNISKILKELRVSLKTIQEVVFLIDNYNYQLDNSKISVKHLLSITPNLDINLFDSLIDLKEKSDLLNKNNNLDYNNIRLIAKNILANNEALLIKDLAINGNDLKELNISGKDIKVTLDYLLNKVINEELVNEKEVLLKSINKSI